MPIYEYHCDKCSHDFEFMVFGKEKPFCPSCDSKNVKKLISACGFISKGAGGETTGHSASSSCGSCSSSSCTGCGH